MLKPLETEYQGRLVVLECTHKRIFPPPQMYGATPADIDNLWRQGSLNQTQYQMLKTWEENCQQMVMGTRCLDCPLALKQNPRPGRPHVIETEPWLAAKERMRWEDMKAGRLAQETPKTGFMKTSEALTEAVPIELEPEARELDEEDAPEPEPEAPEEREPVEEDAPDPDEPEEQVLEEEDAPAEREVEPEITIRDDALGFDLTSALESVNESEETAEKAAEKTAEKTVEEDGVVDDDFINALADD